MRILDRLRPSSPKRPLSEDGRPLFAIGHVPITGSDIGCLAAFYGSIGCRKVARLPGVAILELRGGTHLAITSGPSGVTTLDLMVDDLDTTRQLLISVGARPSEITRRLPHRVFTANDPEGNTLLIHSSHVAGVV